MAVLVNECLMSRKSIEAEALLHVGECYSVSYQYTMQMCGVGERGSHVNCITFTVNPCKRDFFFAA